MKGQALLKRLLAMALVVMMVFSVMPLSAFATEGDTTTEGGVIEGDTTTEGEGNLGDINGDLEEEEEEI